MLVGEFSFGPAPNQKNLIGRQAIGLSLFRLISAHCVLILGRNRITIQRHQIIFSSAADQLFGNLVAPPMAWRPAFLPGPNSALSNAASSLYESRVPVRESVKPRLAVSTKSKSTPSECGSRCDSLGVRIVTTGPEKAVRPINSREAAATRVQSQATISVTGRIDCVTLKR